MNDIMELAKPDEQVVGWLFEYESPRKFYFVVRDAEDQNFADANGQVPDGWLARSELMHRGDHLAEMWEAAAEADMLRSQLVELIAAASPFAQSNSSEETVTFTASTEYVRRLRAALSAPQQGESA